MTDNPRPFSGILSVLYSERTRCEIAEACMRKAGNEPPKYLLRERKALDAALKIVLAVEPYWAVAPPKPLSVKQMIADFEATQPKRNSYYSEPAETKID